jgi:hypothetical protein
MTSSAVIQLVYLSSATQWPSSADLQALLRQSRERNRASGITGMLLYKNAQFIQLLEGEADAVHDVFASIRRDPRHTGVVTLVEQPAAERDFSEWYMGFRDLDDDAEPPAGFADVFAGGFDKGALLGSGERLVRLLRRFAESP